MAQKNSLSWAFADRFVQGVLAFAIQIGLARLLTPHDFGVVALTGVFIALATGAADAGLASALIQRKDASEVDFSSVFFFNLGVGVVTAAMLGLSAPAIAAIFGEPQLEAVVSVLAVRVVLSLAGTVPGTVLVRNLEFKKLFWMGAPLQLVGGAAGITAALLGWGVWALVIQAVVFSALSTTAAFLLSKWRPLWAFDLRALRSMAPFGVRLFLAGMLDQVFNNLHQLVIGWNFNAALVGLYARAANLQQFPVSNIGTVLANVSFPLIAQKCWSPEEARTTARKFIQLAALTGFPAMLGMLIVAEPLVLVVLGPQWTECVPMLQVLCLSGLLYPLSAVNVTILKAVGRADLFLRVEMMKKLVHLTVVAATAPFGVMAMIWGQVFTAVVCFWLNARLNFDVIGYSLRAQLRDGAVPLLLSLGMAAAVLGLMSLPFRAEWRLALSVLGGAGLFAGLVALWLHRTNRTWAALHRFAV